MRWWAAVLLLVCGPVMADWDSLAPGYWEEVANTNMSADGLGDDGIFDGWSGGFFDTERDYFCIHGGGHGDSSDNGIYCIDINTFDQADPVWFTVAAETPSKTGGSDGTDSCGCYGDGSPRADHTYNVQQYIPAPYDELHRFALVSMSSSGNGSIAKHYYNDLQNTGSIRGWYEATAVPADFDSGNKGPTAYNPLTEIAYYQTDKYQGGANARWYSYEMINDTWALHAGNVDTPNDHRPAVVDPSRWMVMGVAGGPVVWHDIGKDLADQTSTLENVSGPTFSNGWPTAAWDPVSDRIVAWDTGTSTWSYDPDSHTWTECLDDALNSVTPSAPQTNGTYGRWQYIPSKNAFILLNARTQNVYIYRLPTSCLGMAKCTNATYNPVAGTSDFFDTVNGEGLGCGDEVIVGAGTHTWTSKLNMGSRGTPENPIVIRGVSDDPKPIIWFDDGGTGQNTLNFRGAAYVELRDLEIKGGADCIKIEDSTSGGRMAHHITIEGNKIHSCNVGIAMNTDDVHSITVDNNEITDTAGTGEGMYIGCNNEACRAWMVHVKNNWIHDMGGSQGDGIECKDGSHCIIEDNVVHGGGSGAPCIWVYGSILGPETNGGYTQPRSVIRRNAVWDCNDDGAISVVRDVIVENNVAIGDANSVALTIKTHSSGTPITPRNLQIRHNVFYNAASANVLSISNLGSTGDVEFEGNAVYGSTADPYDISGWGDASLDDNVIDPYVAADWAAGTYITGNDPATDFIDAANRDFYPKVGSALINACIDFGLLDKTWPKPNAGNVGDDYNLTLRSPSNDCGAYTVTTATNPVGPIAAGFKAGESGAGSKMQGGSVSGGSIGQQ